MSALATVPNPFDGTVVADAWSAPPADVTAIHRKPFEECLRALDSVSRGRSDSILIYGPAGSGKTHLLARLQAHLLATAGAAPDGALRCVFVAVKLQTSAQLLWQLVRRRLASDLLRKQQGITQLQRLVAHQLAAARGNTPRHWVMALRVLPSADTDSVTEYLEEVAERLELGRDLCVVLGHLVNNRFMLDAKAWLAGDSLPESALAKLGLGGEEQDDREEAARQIVTALCRLAGETLPIVFCFDQIEALQTSPDDRDALFRFGRVAADLSEADDNVLLISCIQSAFVDMLRASIRDADRDRIMKRRALLDALTREQVEALITSRLDGSEPLGEARAANAANRFHPFDERVMATLRAISPCLPRKVIAAASNAFERLQREGAPPAEPPKTEDVLRQTLSARRDAALSRGAAESRDTLMHGLPLLYRLRGQPPSGQRVPGVDVVLPARAGLVGVTICNETNMKSLAARLRQLTQGGDALAGVRLTIVRDARLPITPTAKKTQEYLAELEKKGARVVSPSVEALAALEALRSLLSDARAGDLAARGDAVGEPTVAAWLVKNLDEALLDLCDGIEGAGEGEGRARAPDAGAAELARALGDLMLRRFVTSLDEVAAALGADPEALLAEARRAPDRFGVLEGPPAVIFVHVPADALTPALEG